MFFFRFLRRSRNPLRESAWSRCKNSRFFATFVVRTGVVRAPAPGTGGSRVRFLPGPRGRRKMQLAFYSNLRRATCAEQVAQSNLRRPTCTDQFAQSALPRATCAEQLTYAEQLAQSSLHRATCRERNLHRATCRDQLAGATCAEQLAQSNLHSATCVEQLAQTNLHRPVCAEHLAWCCLALASRSVGKKNASCSVGPTSLAMFCFRANRGLVQNDPNKGGWNEEVLTPNTKHQSRRLPVACRSTPIWKFRAFRIRADRSARSRISALAHTSLVATCSNQRCGVLTLG